MRGDWVERQGGWWKRKQPADCVWCPFCFVWKNDINKSHLLMVKELEMVSMCLRSLLMVEKGLLGLL